MSPVQIARRVWLHNAAQLVIGIALIPTSILLWFVSFGFFQIAVAAPLAIVLDDEAWAIGYYVAWLCMIPLAIEGFLRTQPLFDGSDYVRIDRNRHYGMVSGGMLGLGTYYGNPLALTYWVSQVLYSAPRTIVLSIKSFRSFLPVGSDMATDAARILAELKASRKWTPAENYRESGAALVVLGRLHLIWTELKTGQLEIRYPAGVK